MGLCIVPQVRKETGLDENQIVGLARSNKLYGKKIGRWWFFEENEVEEYIKENPFNIKSKNENFNKENEELKDIMKKKGYIEKEEVCKIIGLDEKFIDYFLKTENLKEVSIINGKPYIKKEEVEKFLSQFKRNKNEDK